MIQNHPFCPKSAMEKYYIEQQLPQYQTLPQQSIQKKNHSYYHDNTNIWNNNHQSSSNMKVFAKIQEQNKRGEQRIQNLRAQEQKDKQILQMSKYIYFNQLRQEDMLRMQTRKLERAGLQNLSQQQTDIEADQLLLKQTQHNVTLQGRPEFLWNKVGQHSQKHIKMLVNPKIMQMEEEAIKLIEKRIVKEQQVERIKKDLISQNRQQLRQLSVKRKQENNEVHFRAGLSPIHKVNSSKTTHIYKSGPSLDIIESTLQQIEEKQQRSSRPFTVNSDNEKVSFSFNNSLSKNQKGSLSIKKRQIDRSEYKGLYIAQEDSNFSKTIRSNYTISKNNQVSKQIIENNEDVNKILDSFENKLQDKQHHY